MQLNRCPICHHRISLDALAQDESGRELLAILAKLDTDSGTALISYLGLFRSSTRDLANDKAIRLAKEVLDLGPMLQTAAAMRQTVNNLQGKSDKPLTNHNYLKKVLSDMPLLMAGFDPMRPVGKPMPTKVSKTAQSLQALENYGSE